MLWAFGTKMPYYHVTPTANIPRIKKEGLLPQVGPRAQAMEQEGGIYLFTSLGYAEDATAQWLGDEFDEDQPLALLEVTLPPGAQTHPTSVDWEITVTDPIPPQYIKVLNT